MKATFFERATAYIIDFLIISILLSIICYNIPTNNVKKYEKEMEEITNKFVDQEITEKEYISKYSNILYNNQKSNVLVTEITVAVIIAYFVIFQYMNKGQTFGKKLMKIKIVNRTTKKPITIFKGFIRSMFIYNVVSSIIGIILIYITNIKNYFIFYGTISGLESLFILITIFFVLYRKDSRGIHDMMANTEVIKVVKEGR